MCWTVNEIKKGVWHVDESGLNAMYVVKGSKMSAVIDAGTGIGDFKGLVESLVDNPYVVLITHGHVDHAGGCGQFIEAYINERDYQAALNIKVEDRERSVSYTHLDVYKRQIRSCQDGMGFKVRLPDYIFHGLKCN